MRRLVLLAGIVLATSSFAETTIKSDQSDTRKSYTGSMFQKMDTDQDGNISEQSMKRASGKKWKNAWPTSTQWMPMAMDW